MGATAYVTATPCWNCLKILVAAGIKRVVFDCEYSNAAQTHPPNVHKLLSQADVTLVHLAPVE